MYNYCDFMEMSFEGAVLENVWAEVAVESSKQQILEYLLCNWGQNKRF